MSIKDLSHFKIQVHEACVQLVQTQLDTIQSSLDQLMEAKSSETKSSAGDKYETGMAMIQNQEELFKRQQMETQSRMNQLKSIDPNTAKHQVEKGALVKTGIGIFYLAIGLGKINIAQQEVFVLSMESPLGIILKEKSIGESFNFNGNTSHIESLH